MCCCLILIFLCLFVCLFWLVSVIFFSYSALSCRVFKKIFIHFPAAFNVFVFLLWFLHIVMKLWTDPGSLPDSYRIPAGSLPDPCRVGCWCRSASGSDAAAQIQQRFFPSTPAFIKPVVKTQTLQAQQAGVTMATPSSTSAFPAVSSSSFLSNRKSIQRGGKRGRINSSWKKLFVCLCCDTQTDALISWFTRHWCFCYRSQEKEVETIDL